MFLASASIPPAAVSIAVASIPNSGSTTADVGRRCSECNVSRPFSFDSRITAQPSTSLPRPLPVGTAMHGGISSVICSPPAPDSPYSEIGSGWYTLSRIAFVASITDRQPAATRPSQPSITKLSAPSITFCSDGSESSPVNNVHPGIPRRMRFSAGESAMRLLLTTIGLRIPRIASSSRRHSAAPNPNSTGIGNVNFEIIRCRLPEGSLSPKLVVRVDIRDWLRSQPAFRRPLSLLR